MNPQATTASTSPPSAPASAAIPTSSSASTTSFRSTPLRRPNRPTSEWPPPAAGAIGWSAPRATPGGARATACSDGVPIGNVRGTSSARQLAGRADGRLSVVAYDAAGHSSSPAGDECPPGRDGRPGLAPGFCRTRALRPGGHAPPASWLGCSGCWATGSGRRWSCSEGRHGATPRPGHSWRAPTAASRTAARWAARPSRALPSTRVPAPRGGRRVWRRAATGRRRHLGEHAQRAGPVRTDRVRPAPHRDLLGPGPDRVYSVVAPRRRGATKRAALRRDRGRDRLLQLAARRPRRPRACPDLDPFTLTWSPDRVSGVLPAGAPAYPTSGQRVGRSRQPPWPDAQPARRSACSARRRSRTRRPVPATPTRAHGPRTRAFLTDQPRGPAPRTARACARRPRRALALRVRGRKPAGRRARLRSMQADDPRLGLARPWVRRCPPRAGTVRQQRLASPVLTNAGLAHQHLAASRRGRIPVSRSFVPSRSGGRLLPAHTCRLARARLRPCSCPPQSSKFE